MAIRGTRSCGWYLIAGRLPVFHFLGSHPIALRISGTALAYSPDSGTLAVAVGRVVQLWDVTTGQLVACPEGHERKVMCLAYPPDGTRLASGSYDKTVRLWDVSRYR